MPPAATIPPIPPPPKTRISALGILDEIDVVLERHRQQTSPKLAAGFNPIITRLLPTLGIKGLSQPQQDQIVAEVATETARDVLQTIPRIRSLDQSNQVLADSLTQSLIAHPLLENQEIPAQTKIYETVAPQTQEVTQANLKDLEKAAVLGQLAQIAKLQKPDQETLELTAREAEEVVEAKAPLNPELQPAIKGVLGTYLTEYVQDVTQELAEFSQDNLPSFDQLQKAKETAHNSAVTKVNTNLSQSPLGKQIAQKTSLKFKETADELGGSLGLKPLSDAQVQSHGLGNARPKRLAFAKAPARLASFGIGLALNSPTIQQEANSALLAYNRPKLQKSLAKLSAQIEKFRGKKSLSFSERKESLAVNKKLAVLQKAQQFTLKQPKRFKTYLAYFQSLPPGKRLDWSSNQAWRTTGAFLGQFPGIFVPITAVNPPLVASRTFGGLSFGLGAFRPGSLKSVLSFGKPAVGMGRSVATKIFVPLMMIGAGLSILKKIAKIGGAVLGALGLYFLGLGQAAFMGFMIGAGIGGIAGAISGAVVGAQIGATIGTFFLPGIGTLIGGAIGGLIGAAAGFVGGAVIGGIAGGLTAFGLASGSTAIAGTGIGMTAGAVVGTFVIPIPFVGTLLGAAIGAGLGWAIGNYVIPAIKAAYDAVASIFSGAGTATSGALASIGTFFTGLASSLWGGITTTAGTVGGWFASAFNSVLGAAESVFAGTASAAAPVVVGAIGTVTVGSVIVGAVIVPTAFFNAQTDIIVTSENQYATMTKTAAPNLLKNEEAITGKEVDYSIKITAKDQDITNVTIKNATSVSPISKPSFADFPNDKDGKDITSFNVDILEAGQTKTINYSIFVQGENYQDSTIVDTATASFEAEGQESSISASSSVRVGPVPLGDCQPASDNNPENGIETSPEELLCYIHQVAAGKTEPLTGLNLAEVMDNVMNAESGGRQCDSGDAAEIGVFQYIAATWKVGIKSQAGVDSGSKTGNQTCWGIPGPDPTATRSPPVNNPYAFDWVHHFGPDQDGGAWNPYDQIDNTVWMMERGDAYAWTTYKCYYVEGYADDNRDLCGELDFLL